VLGKETFLDMLTYAFVHYQLGVVRVMRIFLDDERPTPQGWVRAYWPQEVIALLEAGGVTEISLDHDLGNDERGTGYDVVLWVEEAVAIRGFVAPKLGVHSANSSARAKMEQGIAKIERLTSQLAQAPNKSLERTREG
jgi:hypothetical protein